MCGKELWREKKEGGNQREGGSLGGRMGLGGGMWGITGYLMNEIKLALLVYAVYLVFW